MLRRHPEVELIPYMHGELDEPERARVAIHLDSCGSCREQADALTRTLGLITRELAQMPTPESSAFRADLRRKLAVRESVAQRWWQRPIFAWGSLAAAGVAAVALVSLNLLHRGPYVAVPTTPTPTISMIDQLAFEDVVGRTDVSLLRNYPMVERLDLLENDNYEVIEHLDELAPSDSKARELRHL